MASMNSVEITNAMTTVQPVSGVPLINSTADNVSGEEIDLHLLLASGPVYLNEQERVTTSLWLFFLLLVALPWNCLTVAIVAKDHKLHTPYLVAIASQALGDSLALAGFLPQSLYTILVGNTHHYDNYRVACFISRLFIVPPKLGQSQTISVIAVERYLFFCWPLSYARLVSVKRIMIVEGIVYGTAYVYTVILSWFRSSYYSVSALTCSLHNLPGYTYYHMILWYIPNVIMVIFMTIVLASIVAKQRRQIHDHQLVLGHVMEGGTTNRPNMNDKEVIRANTIKEISVRVMPPPKGPDNTLDIFVINDVDSEDQIKQVSVGTDVPSDDSLDPQERWETPVFIDEHPSDKINKIQNNPEKEQKPPDAVITVPEKRKPKRQRTLNNFNQNAIITMKMLCSISLSFWIIYIPVMICIIQIMNKISIIDLELGKYPKYYFLMRVMVMLIGASLVLNPILHFYFNAPLRQAFKRLISHKVKNDDDTFETSFNSRN